MKNIYHSLSLIILSLLPISAFAQQTKLLTAEKHNEYGLVYTLPVTALNIEVTAVKEVRIAGPYSKYSKIFTSQENVFFENQELWSIESVKVTPVGIPDEENRYLMQLKAGATTFICVSEDGMLRSINKEVEQEAAPKTEISVIEGTVSSGKEYLQFVNEDFIAAQSSYKQAQILAEELMEIRDAKISLTRGTAETMPTDGRQLEIMLASLDNQEKALMQAFTGSSWKEKKVTSYVFVPEEEGKFVLCKINEKTGLTEASGKNGEPLYVAVKITEQPQLPTDSKGEEKKLPKDAVMYNVPGYAQISLIYKSSSLYQQEIPVSQFGFIFGLNPSIFTDKKEPSFAIFNPSTGAIEELGVIK